MASQRLIIGGGSEGMMVWYAWKWWIFAWSLNGESCVVDSHKWVRVIGGLMIRTARQSHKCGGVMQASLGSIDSSVLLECRQCGATRVVDGNDYSLGLYDSYCCQEPCD